MQTVRLLLAAPFLVVAGVAYLLMGLQLILAAISLLSGTSLIDALTGWVLGTAFFGILGTVTGVIAMVALGSQSWSTESPTHPVGQTDPEGVDTPATSSEQAATVEIGDRVVVRIDTMMPARHRDGWQLFPVSNGDAGVVVATQVADWENAASAELPDGGLTSTSESAVAVWLDGREFAVPSVMFSAGQVEILPR